MLAVASKLMEAIQCIFCFLAYPFPQGNSLILESASLEEIRDLTKNLRRESWLDCGFFLPPLTWQQLGIRLSLSPLLLHLSTLTASQESSSHRNERGRQRKIRRERGDGEEEGGKLEGGKEETKLQWGREVMGILTALIWPVYSLLCSWW